MPQNTNTTDGSKHNNQSKSVPPRQDWNGNKSQESQRNDDSAKKASTSTGDQNLSNPKKSDANKKTSEADVRKE